MRKCLTRTGQNAYLAGELRINRFDKLPGVEFVQNLDEVLALRRHTFRFVDLFSGIGGFHAALKAFGGECVWASEIDPDCRRVYEANWGLLPAGDIVPLTHPKVADCIPPHDVLTAGFPCQPFSKSGKQLGLEDATRGTLFFNICSVLEARRPALVLLENVKNLLGPRHVETHSMIVSRLRDIGYRVSESSSVLSPHRLPPSFDGRPQVRERVFIVGTYVGRDRAISERPDRRYEAKVHGCSWDHNCWSIDDILESYVSADSDTWISEREEYWLTAWEDFQKRIRKHNRGTRMPGFPIWTDSFLDETPIDESLPLWKKAFLIKNRNFYLAHKTIIDSWLRDWDHLDLFPAARRKLEWQAQDQASIWDGLIQFRPSGIRVKRDNYVPALVAMTQTPVVGKLGRRLTVREAARLQGFDDSFGFGEQSDTESFKQLGNAVNVGVAKFVFASHLAFDAHDIKQVCPRLTDAVDLSISKLDKGNKAFEEVFLNGKEVYSQKLLRFEGTNKSPLPNAGISERSAV